MESQTRRPPPQSTRTTTRPPPQPSPSPVPPTELRQVHFSSDDVHRVILLRRGCDREAPCYIAFVRPQSVVGGEDILRLLSIAADAVDPCPVWEPHGVVKKTFIQVRLLLNPLRVGRCLCWKETLNHTDPVSGWKSAGPKTSVLYPSPFLQKSYPIP